MNTSSKQSAVVAALILAASMTLAGCGGGDDAEASADGTATPAWDSTPADPNATSSAPAETPAATTPPAETPAAEAGQPPAEGADGATGGSAPGNAPGGGDANGAAPEGGGAEGGAGGDAGAGGTEDPPVDPVDQPFDACSMGAAAITDILGATTTEDMSDPAAFGPACAWTNAAGHEVAVSVAGYDDWVGMDDLLGGDAQPVDDLGTEAWASTGSPSNVQVAWRRDEISVSVAASLESGAEKMVNVARAVDAALLAAGY